MSCPLVTAAAEWCKSSDVPLISPSIHTMTVSDNSTQRTQALALLKRRGMTRLAEFSEAGITATTVGRMKRAGEVVRLARGLYQLQRSGRGTAPRVPPKHRAAHFPSAPAASAQRDAAEPSCVARAPPCP